MPDTEGKTACRTVTGNGSGLTVDLQKYNDGSYDWQMVNNGRNYANNDTVEIPVLATTSAFWFMSGPKRLFLGMTLVGGTTAICTRSMR